LWVTTCHLPLSSLQWRSYYTSIPLPVADVGRLSKHPVLNTFLSTPFCLTLRRSRCKRRRLRACKAGENVKVLCLLNRLTASPACVHSRVHAHKQRVYSDPSLRVYSDPSLRVYSDPSLRDRTSAVRATLRSCPLRLQRHALATCRITCQCSPMARALWGKPRPVTLVAATHIACAYTSTSFAGAVSDSARRVHTGIGHRVHREPEGCTGLPPCHSSSRHAVCPRPSVCHQCHTQCHWHGCCIRRSGVHAIPVHDLGRRRWRPTVPRAAATAHHSGAAPDHRMARGCSHIPGQASATGLYKGPASVRITRGRAHLVQHHA
jgi:hypothetical protein